MAYTKIIYLKYGVKSEGNIYFLSLVPTGIKGKQKLAFELQLCGNGELLLYRCHDKQTAYW